MGNIVRRPESKEPFQGKDSNGKIAFIPKDATSFNNWIASRKPTAEKLLPQERLMGFPTFGRHFDQAMDCSGFVKTVLFLNGMITRRDASQQAKVGDDVSVELPRDLIPATCSSSAVNYRRKRKDNLCWNIPRRRQIHTCSNQRPINSLIPDTEDF